MEGKRYITIYVNKALFEFLEVCGCYQLLLEAVEYGLKARYINTPFTFNYSDSDPIHVLVDEKLAEVWEEASQELKDYFLFVIDAKLMFLEMEYAISGKCEGGEA